MKAVVGKHSAKPKVEYSFWCVLVADFAIISWMPCCPMVRAAQSAGVTLDSDGQSVDPQQWDRRSRSFL